MLTHIRLPEGDTYILKLYEELIAADFCMEGKCYHLLIKASDTPVPVPESLSSSLASIASTSLPNPLTNEQRNQPAPSPGALLA